MASFRKTRDALIRDLESNSFIVRPWRSYGRGVDAREICYRYNGELRFTGDIITTSQGVDVLAYQTERTDEMKSIAQLHCRRVVDEVTSFRAVETYLEELRMGKQSVAATR